MGEIYCPLCKEKNKSFVFSIDGYELRACDVCDLNFIHPYIQKDKDRNPLSVQNQLVSEQKSVKGYFLYISDYFKTAKSYLDIGCGCGGLLKKAQEFNIPIRNGVEEDKNRATYAKIYADCEIFDKGIFGMDQIRTYDLISLVNVFSHISDLDSFFSKMVLMLNENGKIIIKTGLFKKGFRKYNLFDWQIPEHLHFIGEKTMAYIAEKYNFTCIESINIPLANELITKSYLTSPGRSKLKNVLKAILCYMPGFISMFRRLYTIYTKDKNYTSIIVLQKK